MKRILVFCPYYPPHFGGLESHAKEFNEKIKKYCSKVVVFTPNLPETKFGVVLEDGTEVVRFPAFELVSNWPVPKFWQVKFWKLFLDLFDQEFDIVISRTRFFLTSLMALVYSKIKKVKWIHIEHGSDFVKLTSPISNLLARLYDEVFGRLIFKFSSLNVPISRAVDGFVERFDKRKRTVIYRGMNFDDINKIKKDEKFDKKYKDYLKLIWDGRLYKWKGLERSINIVNILPKKIRDKVVFIIVGDGEDFERLKKYENKNIVFVGYKKRDEVMAIVKCGNIYMHSSYPGGGLSTSLLEAMSCGLCSIASPCEGADEVVVNNKNGFLVDYDDSAKVINLIEKLYNKPVLIKKLGIQAQRDIQSKFGWDKSILQYKKVIKNLILE